MHVLQQRARSVPSVGQLPIGKVSMGPASKVGCHGVGDGGRLAAGIRLRRATNANDQGSGAKGDGLRLNKLLFTLRSMVRDKQRMYQPVSRCTFMMRGNQGDALRRP